MITLLSPNFVLQEVTEDDLALASLAWGFTIGFGWLTTWTAVKQTKRIYERRGLLVFRNAYVWMIWLEILVCLIFSIIYPITGYRLKVGVAVLIIAVNISVYNIWIPARLQISERYVWINEWWDRVEKVIYLLVDGALNFYFIRIYKGLVKFNMCIVGFSLSMDVLIISMMSLHNTFVYMQFHPFAYMVKLKIEMTRVSTDGIRTAHGVDAVSIELQEGPDGSAAFNGRSKTNRDTGFLSQSSSPSLQVGVAIYTTENNRIDVDAATSNNGESTCSVTDSFDENGSARKDNDDERRLRYKQMEDKK
ncbi:hypothetical protein EDB81DRAFT_916545 [Dactylonectria macrodidyma]|uniref:Uncharacterized protein n=1 Tax=Dactylonectria macrodidyma TaxID=307937 RepID=A0A9P9D9J7_9HYPO|nr:hypothetical protein EDB81DRAFT_916545 [Dactylonectria macrodidyma]